ncbi:MAG TPA: Crp/Fnr family transcriptional regulator [Chitinophagales bacterium]|nr:Crp/Fnr family transcriptional regulator [Chitinophagales bacterium]HMZ93047.1 Crp/Fnr family transcriptional regulator [Chitinophagales bacterium]
MHIDYNILIAYGGIAKRINKGDFIFKQDSLPLFYYQVIKGEVRIFSSNTEDKFLTHNIVSEGEGFGESELLLNKPHLVSAQALSAGVFVRIPKENFNNILKDFPDINQQLIHSLAEEIYDNILLSQIWTAPTPEIKIELFLNRYKKQNQEKDKPEEKILIPYTRQQIADFTSLRVETVIRTLRKMSEQQKVKIVQHKVYF